MKYVIHEESMSWPFEERCSGEGQVISCLTNFNPGNTAAFFGLYL